MTHQIPASDTEGGEKPVREQLKKTSIDATNDQIAPPSDDATLRRKRSRDDDDDEEEEESLKNSSRHGRKRSRDNDAESPEAIPSDDAEPIQTDSEVNGASTTRSGTPPIESTGDSALSENLISPKGKRTRAQFQRDDEERPITSTAQAETIIPSDKTDTIKSLSSDESDERGAKRPREIGDENNGSTTHDKKGEPAAPRIPPTSGFANSSSLSPFASLSGNIPQKKDAAPVAEMQQSTIKDLKPVSSPFGALGQSSGSSSPFSALAGATKASIESAPKTASAFGSLSGTQSAFGSIGSKPGLSAGFGGFGSTGSPFASALSGKSSLSSFASGTSAGAKPPILGLSSKPAKPFGAPLSDDEGNGGSDDEDADATDVSKDIEQGISAPNNVPKRDKRFVEQEVETGEEHERTLFSSRAKLYYFDAKEGGWKERGVGTFKFNVTRSEGSADTDDEDVSELPIEKRARFIMRAEGSHRLLLNSPLSQQTKFGDANGESPKGTTVLWYGVLDGHEKPVGLQLRMKADLITSLWEIVNETKEELA